MSRSSLFAVTWEAGGGEELGEAGNCIAGVNFGKAACSRLDSYGPHADAATGRSPPALRAAVAAELADVFGAETIEEQLLEVYHQAWMGEPLTWDDGDGGSDGDPRSLYGHPLLREPTGWGVHWAGTETERMSGHVDGAVAAGERVAEEIAAAAAAVGKGGGGGEL
jgi:monoamine oxidase